MGERRVRHICLHSHIHCSIQRADLLQQVGVVVKGNKLPISSWIDDASYDLLLRLMFRSYQSSQDY